MLQLTSFRDFAPENNRIHNLALNVRFFLWFLFIPEDRVPLPFSQSNLSLVFSVLFSSLFHAHVPRTIGMTTKTTTIAMPMLMHESYPVGLQSCSMFFNF